MEEVSHQVEYVSGHRRQFVVAGAVLLVALVGGGGYWTYSQQRASASRTALIEAVYLFHGIVTEEDLPGVETFATENERVEAVTRALDALALDYSGTAAAAGAAYYSGLLDREQGNLPEAEAHFEQAVRGLGDEYPGLARLALGALLLEEGDAEAARVHFQAVADNPTRTVPRDRALVEVARTFVKTDPAQARERLQAIQAENGPASPLAATVLETLGEGG